MFDAAHVLQSKLRIHLVTQLRCKQNDLLIHMTRTAGCGILNLHDCQPIHEFFFDAGCLRALFIRTHVA